LSRLFDSGSAYYRGREADLQNRLVLIARPPSAPLGLPGTG